MDAKIINERVEFIIIELIIVEEQMSKCKDKSSKAYKELSLNYRTLIDLYAHLDLCLPN